MFYHNILSLIHKPKAIFLVLWMCLYMIYHPLYHIKAPATMSILMSTIMMIRIYFKHLVKIITVPTHLVIQKIQLPHQLCSDIISVPINKIHVKYSVRTMCWIKSIKEKIMFAGYVLKNQNARQSEHGMHRGRLFQSFVVI